MGSKFALGMLTAVLITTKEGNSVLKSCGVVANKMAKKKLGLDLKDLFEEENNNWKESEVEECIEH